VNNDGRIDFFVADMAATTHATDQHFLADARGRTAEPADTDHCRAEVSPQCAPVEHRPGTLPRGSQPRRHRRDRLDLVPSIEDLDNDGRLDLFVTNDFHGIRAST